MNNGREAGEAQPLLPQAARPQRKINLKLWKLWAIVAIFATLLVSVVVLLTRRPIPPLFYPPLDYSRDSLRLLQLHPGSGRQEIQSTISDVKFISNPTYSALSYTWGSPDRTNSIKVNGSRLQIRENLWNALHDLRDPKMTRVLWVDAICIDQNNVDEKNHQVPLMSFVYSRAQEVLIWLGEHKAPYWIESSAPSEWRDDWAVRKAKASWWTGATHAFLYGLVHEEYWKRAWIVQEVGMAPKTIRVHFGRQSIPWEEFMKLIRLYRAATVGNAVNLENILKLDSLRGSKYKDGKTYSVGTLLNSFRDAFASISHDKIYAFLGMANDLLDKSIQIDYLRSKYSVYLDVITFQNSSTFDSEETLIDMVYFSGLVRRLLTRDSGLVRKDKPFFGYLADPNSWMYYGCKDGECSDFVEMDPDRGGQMLLGWLILDLFTDFMKWLGSFIIWPTKEYIAVWHPSNPEVAETWLSYPNLSSNLEGIKVRGAIAGNIELVGPSYLDIIGSSETTRKWDATLSGYFSNETDLSKARGNNERLKAILGSSADLGLRNIVSFDSTMNEGNSASDASPRLFIGSETMLGLLPPNARKGDLICQFWNASSSAVLRRSEDGHYRIVGRAGIVRKGKSIHWDVPIDREPFISLSDRHIDLAVDMEILTRLSFDVVNLPGTS